MRIQSFLVQGAGSALAGRLGSLAEPLDALVLLSLGVKDSALIDAIGQHKDKMKGPVYMSETYGIIGFDEDLQQNVELMEKGRGSEYGYVGGSGGQGCLVIGYYDGATAGHTSEFPDGISSLMVIADQSKSWAKDKDKAPLHFGGITKTCWKVNIGSEVSLEEVPYFWIAETTGEPTGVVTFDGEADEAVKSLLEKIPTGWSGTETVALFPCFTRGVNQYGAENVESSAIGRVIASPRIYGMFAHGELGPSTTFTSFTNEVGNKIECDQHSMTSILAIHTSKAEVNSEL